MPAKKPPVCFFKPQMLMDDGMPNCTGNVTGTVTDSSGYGNNGTPSSPAPTWSTDTPFGTGCSAQFDGNNYIALFPRSISPVGSSRAICLWFKTTTVSDLRGLVGTKSGSGTGGFIFATNSGMMQYIHVGGVAGATQVLSSNVIAANKWYFACVSLNTQTATAQLYLNGSLLKSVSGFSTETATTDKGGIGELSYEYGTALFTGNIDNVRIYDRALDTSEIQKLYAMDAGKHGYAFVGSYSPLGETTPPLRGTPPQEGN